MSVSSVCESVFPVCELSSLNSSFSQQEVQVFFYFLQDFIFCSFFFISSDKSPSSWLMGPSGVEYICNFRNFIYFYSTLPIKIHSLPDSIPTDRSTVV